MYGYQIAEFLSKFGTEVYKSIFAITSIDKIPHTIPEHSFVVSNLSLSHQEGQHWIVSIIFEINQFSFSSYYFLQVLSNQGVEKIEIFDSLGLRQNKNLYKKYLPFSSVTINDFAVQDKQSTSCSLFAIYYIINRFYNGINCRI